MRPLLQANRFGQRVDDPPRVSTWLRSAFAFYSRRLLCRQFHAIRLNGPPPDKSTVRHGAQVIFLNHPSWWDPLVCLALWHTFFPHQQAFAPIDASALCKYPFFRRLGFFGVSSESREGAAVFLRVATHLLKKSDTTLWITPQGRFADVRERPLRFKPGLGHLAARFARSTPTMGGRVTFLPLAIETSHWHERQPEILVRFGSALTVQSENRGMVDPREWTRRFEDALEDTMNLLANDAQSRDASRFTRLLTGRAGVGGPYDLWRRLQTVVSGQSFDPRHGNL